MSIVLFAIIGATLDLGTWYWICFGLMCLFKTLYAVLDVIKNALER